VQLNLKNLSPQTESSLSTILQNGTLHDLSFLSLARCGPCKVISPKFEQFEQKYTKAKFIKVDVDQLGEVSAQQGIRAMPTFQIYLYGFKGTEIVGADAKKLEEAISTYNSKV
jgi:thioredoxin 1